MDESIKKFIKEQNEKLAIMVAKGFEQVATKKDIEELRKEMATKSELAELRNEMATGFAEVRNEMATKDDIIQLESKIVSEVDLAHERISVLETRVERLEVVKQ